MEDLIYETIETISGNDSGYDEGNKEVTGGVETPSGEGGEGNGNDASDGTEGSGGDPSGGVSDTAGEVVGGNGSPSEEGAVSPDNLLQAVDGLNAAVGRLSDGAPELGDLLESVRSLVNAISEQSLSVQSNAIPISGYRDYDYPISVTWEVRPSAPNAPSRMESVESFNTPEEFEARYDQMCGLVGVSLNSFRILRISDCSDEEYVYDADNVQEEPEIPEDEEPEEGDTFKEDILAALSGLHEDLQTISMNDLEYRDSQMQLQEQYIAMQEQLSDMQELNTDLQYHMLASNIAIGFTLLLTLGYTVAHGFLQRMKVG